MANVARVALTFRVETAVADPSALLQTALSVVTFHVMSGDSDPVIDEEIREEILFHTLAWWNAGNGGFTEAKSIYPSSLELVAAECRTILPTIGPVNEAAILEPYPGTSATHSLHPPQCALILGLRTAVDSRSGRGRMYMPAWRPGDPVLGIVGYVDTNQRQELANIAAHLAYEMRQVVTPEGPYRLSVYSRALTDPAPVTHFEISDRICTQRRRGIRPLIHTHYGLSGAPL